MKSPEAFFQIVCNNSATMYYNNALNDKPVNSTFRPKRCIMPSINSANELASEKERPLPKEWDGNIAYNSRIPFLINGSESNWSP